MNSSRKRRAPGYLAVALAATVVPSLVSTGASAAAGSSVGTAVTSESLTVAGTSASLRSLAARPQVGAGHLGPEIGPGAELNKSMGPAVGSGSSKLPPPSPANTPVVINQVRHGFEGLDHADQRLAGGGNQFSLEPPDQGLCVGNYSGTAYVVESVNDALQFFDSQSHLYTAPITLSQFFGLAPTIDRTTGRFGPFISDPKCYWDADTGHWFHTALVIGLNPKTGAFQKPAYTALAVSQTADPLSAYYQYRINALDENHKNCPCFGDQPLIGADKYGFYVSTAEYELLPTFGAHFNGAQLYAISKRDLVSGTAGRVVHYSNVTTKSGTMQPATSPNGQYKTTSGGTEFFVSGRDTLLPDGRLRPGQVNRLTAWALVNTSSLNTSTGRPRLLMDDFTTEVYGQPVPMTQRAGPRPLGSSVGEPLPRLAANDERVNQVVYAAGHLYTGVNTIVAPGPRTGIAWFIVDPTVSGGSLTARIHAQGYVAVANNNVAFPSIGVNTSGNGVIAFSLTGPDYYPSAAYQLISPAGAYGPVQVARLGFKPEDGFTCYKAYGGSGVCRWGDYSASVALPDGTVWSATEFIGGRARTSFANWSTFVWAVKP